MKISIRILLINFLIVVLILGSSFFVFYSIAYEVLTSFQTRNLRQSANSFTYAYRSLQSDVEDDFFALYNEGIETAFKNQRLQTKNVDFILEANDKSDGKFSRYVVKDNIYLPERNFNLKEFLNDNPYLILMSFESADSRKYIYGKIINTEMLDDLSQRINADVALIWDGNPVDISNQMLNQNYIYILTQAVDNLKNKNNFELYLQGTESNDILATIYKPTSIDKQDNLSFLIFATFAEAGDLRSTLKSVFLIIGFVGIALSLIFTFLFTDRIRKQITELSRATEQTYWGKYDNKIKVKSKDEIGKLGLAFNKMLDELEKKEIAKNEYAEFITLINRNPTLKEISDVALKKILDSCDFLIGGLYSVDNQVNLISSYGLDDRNKNRSEFSEFIKKVIKNKEGLELFDENLLPVVSTGLLDIKVKYLLFLPILYNNEPVALLELGSLNKPSEEVRDYLEKIKDQLAIGITNAKALSQLENLVTKLKQLNEEYHKQNVQIKEQNETLLQLHNELRLQTEELEKQRQKALNLTEAKSRFLANMSHELRTPMNSILGLTELMLEKGYLEPRNKERLEVVLNSGKRLMNLINDILDLSKIEAGKIELHNEDVMLNDMLEEISGSIAPLANEKGIDYKVVKNMDTHAVINTDRGKVVQVLINLLGNAVKYTDIGEILLKVFVVNEMLTFEVIDTGIGISEEEMKMIFEEFRQLSGSKSAKRGGTGLGLAISKKLAEILGGNLTVESELNKGSIFTFSVPFKQIKLLTPESPKVKVNSEILSTSSSKPESITNKKIRKIVIVDDDVMEFQKYKEELASDKIKIEFIKESEYAFNKISEIQPDLIIVDLMMPKVDGITLSHKLKSSTKTKHIPIIISTAKDISEDEKKSLANIVEDITIKSKGLPVDILRVVKDRIEMLERSEFIDIPGNGKSQKEESEEIKILENEAEAPQSSVMEVLIVDDDPDTLFTLDEIVQSCKCNTVLAKNGKECLEILERKIPDLILLDIIMPEMDGFQTIKQIRKNNKWTEIPVFAVTAQAMREDNEIILKQGFSDYIPKPVNPSVVSDKIQKLITQLKTI
jgi:signal transduction histidine kinase/CheY-like chemotaxis protein/HAMP domain-containing protein